MRGPFLAYHGNRSDANREAIIGITKRGTGIVILNSQLSKNAFLAALCDLSSGIWAPVTGWLIGIPSVSSLDLLNARLTELAKTKPMYGVQLSSTFPGQPGRFFFWRNDLNPALPTIAEETAAI